ncbi:hypothetical protein BGX26_004980 [Mortierella sp. AD094]|nr:hypothetical protein BGX26_004980 [Mortierella sp. AD094]
MFDKLFGSSRDSLSPQETLDLARIHLENARKAKGSRSALALCNDAKDRLSQMKRAMRKGPSSGSVEYQTLRDEVATLYFEHGKVLANFEYHSKATESYKKVAEWGGCIESGKLILSTDHNSSSRQTKDTHAPPATHQNQVTPSPAVTATHAQIFTENVLSLTEGCKLPKAAEKIEDTVQLTYCLSLLQAFPLPDDELDPAARTWLKNTRADSYEQERLNSLASDVVSALGRDEVEESSAVAEVVYLAPVLQKDFFQNLLRRLVNGLEQSVLLDLHILDGLVRLIESARPSYLQPDDLVKILERLSARLQGTHDQSPEYIYRLTQAVSNVLDAMADSHVKGLSREQLHGPLSTYLDGLRLQDSNDPYLVYQAAYAFQALQYVPDDETLWQAVLRRGGKFLGGVSGVVSAVKGLDVEKFITGLGQIQDGASGVVEVLSAAKEAYESMAALAESGQTFIASLKESIRLNRKKQWYTALRGADTLLQSGQLIEFQKLVYEAPCRLDPAFQWGLCERLGKLAADPKWNISTRQHAIAFLGEIYKNDATWGQDTNVKQYVLDVIEQLASSGSVQISVASETLLRYLANERDTKKQDLYRTCRESGSSQHPLRITSLTPSKGSPSLLDRVQLRAAFEGDVHRLRQRCLDRDNAIYIPPQAKAGLNASDDASFPLMNQVMKFLDGDQKVFLLLGDSGAGKSTFNRELELSLWGSYKKEHTRIPLHIHLPTIERPEHDLIGKHLRQAHFLDHQINEMKSQCEFILICDGYDECQSSQNLYKCNQLNQPGQWRAQMVISCRTEYLGKDHSSRFQAIDRNKSTASGLLQEAVIMPFSEGQIQEYIEQYVSKKELPWKSADYRRVFKEIPQLLDLVKNPFLLSLSLETLPGMVDLRSDLSTVKITRVALYDRFVDEWLERNKIRLFETTRSEQESRVFNELANEGFERNGICYFKDLAVAILEKHAGNHVVEYLFNRDQGTWKEKYFGLNERNKLLREACPLSRRGNRYQAIHRSLHEYAIALAVFDPQESEEDQEPKLVRQGDAGPVLGLRGQHILKGVSTTIGQSLLDSPLARNNIVCEPSIIQFLAERAQQEALFKEQLLAVIACSKTEKSASQAAANALTILVKAGVQFNGADLRGIRIPGADLSYGVFDGAQLQGADLTMVNLCNVWLRQADLSGSQMTGTQFGELPLLNDDSKVVSCSYSGDGETFAVALENGQVCVYKTSNWEKVRTIRSGGETTLKSRFSTKGDLVAIIGTGVADGNNVVRLLDLETGECHQTLSHSDYVESIAFSPTGDRIASGGGDKTLRLWDVKTGACLLTLTGHTSPIQSLDFSPIEAQIASGGAADKTLRLWDIETGACIRTLIGHMAWIQSIAYSSKGDRIVSGSYDGTARLWDSKTGACLHVFSGHDDAVMSVAYSPNGSRIVSCSGDSTVRTWEVETGECLEILRGHSEWLLSVAYSPNGDQIASGGMDKTVRLWDIETKATRYFIGGHSKKVQTIAFSPKGDQIASGSADETVRLWDIETGLCRHITSECQDGVQDLAYSPNGDRIAIGSGSLGNQTGTLQLLDVETGERHQILSGLGDVKEIAFSPTGNRVAFTVDLVGKLLDIETGECLQTIDIKRQTIRGISFSPKGDQIAFGGSKIVQLWDVETGICRPGFGDHTSSIWLVKFSPTGDLLASACLGMIIRLWDVNTGACHHVLSGHTKDINSIVFSKTGSLLASASEDLTVRLWDTASGQCRATIQLFQGAVNSIAWRETSDGSYLATACDDRSVRLWQLMEDEDRYDMRLCWSSTHDGLNATNTILQNVQGLSKLNERLLKQRGAVEHREETLF